MLRLQYFASFLLLGSVSAVAFEPRTDPLFGIRSPSIQDAISGVACACNMLQGLYPTNSQLEPTCIFLPTDANQVAKAVATFKSCDAEFAIRGGGHMNYPGSNSINGGVLLALNGLTHLQVRAESHTVEVGPGNKWVDVYAALDPYGQYAIGGRMKSIGVSGLTLIGGFHYFINKYSFAMDRVASYDVVLGNGTQLVANKSSNSDLFWALKGGANNFGVVTKFVFETFDAPKISITVQNFNESAVPAFIKAVCDLAQYDDSSVGVGGVVIIDYNATTKTVSPLLLGVQEGTESPPLRFANFSSVPAVSREYNVTTPLQWHANLDTPFQMFRIQFGQHAVKPDADQIYHIYQVWKSAVDDISDIEGLVPTLVLNMATKNAAAIAQTNGIGNTWGLDASESHIWWQLSTGWALAEDDLRVTSWSRSLVEYLHSLNRAKNLSSEFIYMGDAGEWQDPFVGFLPENVEKMRRTRDKYDVDRVFTRLNWGGFKLGF
ncbi:putative FAD-binding oxidoreductase [Leptodontidium sp. 2 PMI_412]|nr:putative FAD-binding oxidoreductase [Leptodontidium sp. 2 PMI_412]